MLAWVTDQLFPGIVLLVAAGGIPLVLRVASFYDRRFRRGFGTEDQGGRIATTVLLLLGQDAIVAVELALVGGVVFSLVQFPIRAAVVCTLLFAGVHLVTFVDYVLRRRLGLRLNWYFVSYIRWLPLFAASGRRAGAPLPWLVLVGIGYLPLLCWILAVAFRGFGPIWPRPEWYLIALLLPLLGVVAHKIAHLTRADDEKNLFLEWTLKALRRARWKRRRISPVPPNFIAWFSPTEEFTAGSADAPLFRLTQGYRGESAFEFDIGSANPHVILLFLESFAASVIGSISGDIGASPEFDGMAANGVLFRRCYSNGVQTARAVVSSLFGIPPRFTEQPAQADLRGCPRLRGVPHFFEELDYYNAYFHNGSLAFEHQGLFATRNGYRELHGCEEIQQQFPHVPILGGWGLPDECLMRYFVRWLERRDQQGQPTFSTLFTMTNHDPFEIPDNFSSPVFHFPGNPEKELFLRTFYYTDYCLGLLGKLLVERGLDKKSVLVILADTPQPLGEHANWTEQLGLFEENLHIPLLIVAPGRIRLPVVIDAPCSQLDLLPTFIDLWQRPFSHHSLGTSLKRTAVNRSICFNNPFGTRPVALRQGKHKLLHEMSTGALSLYDLADDPAERRNIAGLFPELTDSFNQNLLSAHSLVQSLYEDDRFCS